MAYVPFEFAVHVRNPKNTFVASAVVLLKPSNNLRVYLVHAVSKGTLVTVQDAVLASGPATWPRKEMLPREWA